MLIKYYPFFVKILDNTKHLFYHVSVINIEDNEICL